MNNQLMNALQRIVTDVLRTGLRDFLNGRSGSRTSQGGTRSSAPRASADYPGDYQGMPAVSYAPMAGNRPDPGEVVWAWVPYEEDHTRGKDRPVLLVGRDGGWLLGVQLTSKDHDRDAGQEARAGRYWVEVGTGAWDSKRRVSEARVNRVVRIDPDAVRRTSVALPRETFDLVIRGMREHLG